MSLSDVLTQLEDTFSKIQNEFKEIPNDVSGIAKKTSKIADIQKTIESLQKIVGQVQNYVTSEKSTTTQLWQQLKAQFINQIDRDLDLAPIEQNDQKKIIKRTENANTNTNTNANTNANAWITVGHDRKNIVTNPGSSGSSIPTSLTPPNNSAGFGFGLGGQSLKMLSKPISREVAPGVYIAAFNIDRPEYCHKYLGWWCYSETTKRFHLSVNGRMLTAVMTVINDKEKTPIKFHEHNQCNIHGARLDYRRTPFYIPREYNPESDDVRQLTNRMQFVPASHELKENDKYPYRIGCRNSLKQDLVYLEYRDYTLFEDITGNFALAWTASADEMERRVVKE